MVDEPDNIVPIYLRRMDEKIDRCAGDMRDLKVRLTAVEEGVVGVERRMDRLELRIDRIGKRPDLVEVPH